MYAWPEDEVELHCRPSQPGGCRWMKGSTQLGTDCRLRTTERGTITCYRGEETCGSIVLNKPRNQNIKQDNWSHYYDHRVWRYGGERNWYKKSSMFLCSNSGTIIRKDKLCDGTNHCDDGEDERNCKPPCGPPFVREHSVLSSAPLESYPDGSEVTYACQPGFSFDETLSGLKRTCGAGRWTAPPPICRRNVALNGTVSVTGQPMTDCGAAVDGDLNTWCMLAPGSSRQALAVRLPDNATVTKVLVRALSNLYTVKLRDVDQSGDELSCPCQESSSAQIHPAVSGVRVCSCPEEQVSGQRELLVGANSGTFMSLSVAEIVALEASDTEFDECKLLGNPAHGRFEPFGSTMSVKLSCDPGYGPSCSDAVQCSAVRSGKVRLSCLAASCPQPPAIPNTTITHQNGTSWRSVAEYSCRTGYALCPADQNTTSSCDSDGLWSIGYISCLPETDIRVVAMRLGQEHARSMAALRSELLAGQQQLLAEQQQLLAEQNRTQERLSKLERDVALLGLAEGAYLQVAEAAAVQQQLEVEAELAQQEAAVKLERQLVTTTEPEKLQGGAAELAQRSELEAAAELAQLSELEAAAGVGDGLIQ